MPQLTVQNRHQIQMLSWEQFIAPDNEVRIIDALVDYLNLEELGFEQKGKSQEGRSAFPNEVLLKLYLYSYLNRLRSSRQIAKACKVNVELIWLTGGLQPGYKTIANFRKDNGSGLKEVFKQYNLFLKGEGLFDDDTVAVDSFKLRAQNSKKNNYNAKKVKQHLDYIENQTNKYLEELETVDQLEEEQALPSRIAIADQLEVLRERKKKYENLSAELQEKRLIGETQVSTVDQDARALPKKMNIVEVSYNIQTSVSSLNKLITNFEVTNKGDTNALSSVSKKAQTFLGQDQLKVLADKGYDTGVELKHCIESGIETYVAPRQKNTSTKAAEFRKEAFVYNEEADSYTCPAGQSLRSNGRWYNKNNDIHRAKYRVKVYKLPYDVCNACPFKLECAGAANLKNSKGRPIERSEYEPYLESNRERVRLNKELYRKRQQIAEHPFGTIKRQWGYNYTLLKGMAKVENEVNLIMLCYNLRRSISLFGVQGLLERLKRAITTSFCLWPPVEAYRSVIVLAAAKHSWCKRLA